MGLMVIIAQLFKLSADHSLLDSFAVKAEQKIESEFGWTPSSSHGPKVKSAHISEDT
jgi:hypothetical protein